MLFTSLKSFIFKGKGKVYFKKQYYLFNFSVLIYAFDGLIVYLLVPN